VTYCSVVGETFVNEFDDSFSFGVCQFVQHILCEEP